MSTKSMDQLRSSREIYPAVTDNLRGDIVRRIRSVGSPAKILLFGSRARGDHKSDSDLDILILEKSDQLSDKDKNKYDKVLRGVYPELTVIVRSLREAEEWKYVPGHLLTQALSDGKILHQDEAITEGREAERGGSTQVAEQEEIEYKTTVDLAKEWVMKADSDLANARYILETDGPFDTVCFHAQQGAEKYLKAFLGLHGRRIKKTHELKHLLAECSRFAPIAESDALDLDGLSEYAITARYDTKFWPTRETAAEALALAMRIVDILRTRMPPETLGTSWKKPEQAEPVWREAVLAERRWPRDKNKIMAIELYYLGLALDAQKKYAEAESIYKQAVRLDQAVPDNNALKITYRNCLVSNCLSQGKQQQALKWLKQIQQLAPSDASVASRIKQLEEQIKAGKSP